MIKPCEAYRTTKFWISADRLGPDILGTHWRLYFPSTMRRLCHNKFRRFGQGAQFRPGAYAVACSKISIGDRVVIRPGTMLFADPREGTSGTINLEDDVLIGSAVHIYVNNHAFDSTSIPIIDQGHSAARAVTVERGAWIGACAVILPGVSIGRNAVVGAGAVVTRSVPPCCVAAGNPARVLRTLTGADTPIGH